MRIKQLDVLRAIAILLVLGRHGDVHNPVLDFWNRIGWAGVDLFFVLSGFLVSGLLFAEYRKLGHLRVVRFLTRRGLKIYPGFYILIAAAVVYAGPSNVSLKRLAAECLFVQNYVAGLEPHTWSLAVEEHFYFSLALAVWLLARWGRLQLIPWLFAATACVALALRILTIWMQGTNWWGVQLPSHTRMDSLFFGVFLSYLYWFQRDRFDRVSRLRALPALALVCLVPWLVLEMRNSEFMLTAGFTLNYLGFGALLLWMLTLPASAWMTPLAAIGRYSYSIYLWHAPVRFWLMPRLGVPSNTAWHFATYLALSIACGVLLAHVIEFPILALRDRLTDGKLGLPLHARRQPER